MEDDLIDILHKAIESEIGVAVKTDDPDKLRVRFHNTRRKFEGMFDNLSFRVPRHVQDRELWIVKKDQISEGWRGNG